MSQERFSDEYRNDWAINWGQKWHAENNRWRNVYNKETYSTGTDESYLRALLTMMLFKLNVLRG